MTQPDTGQLRIHMDISLAQAQEFMERLASDDDFRAELQDYPTEVLADYGLEVPAELIPTPVTLPPKEEIQEALSAATSGSDASVPPPGSVVGHFFAAILTLPPR